MKKSRYTEEQNAYVLRQADAGTPVLDVCRGFGISEATFYVWKKKYPNFGVSELRRLKLLEEENSRLNRLVADLMLDKHILSEVMAKKSEALSTQGDHALDSRAISDQHEVVLSVGRDQSSRLVSKEHGQRSDALANEDSRDRKRSAEIRVPADPYRLAA